MSFKNLVVLFLFPLTVLAQHPERFAEEIKQMVLVDGGVPEQGVILFTGSSTIRRWKDIQSRFTGFNVLNRGFGGSQMSELVHYFDQVILPYRPKQIFVYEGDNDLASGLSPETILNEAEKLHGLIRKHLDPHVKVMMITPKPSIARWKLKAQYEIYNLALKKWAESKTNVYLIDIWPFFLDRNKEVMKDVFVEYGLHLNRKGYDILTQCILPHLMK